MKGCSPNSQLQSEPIEMCVPNEPSEKVGCTENKLLNLEPGN